MATQTNSTSESPKAKPARKPAKRAAKTAGKTSSKAAVKKTASTKSDTPTMAKKTEDMIKKVRKSASTIQDRAKKVAGTAGDTLKANAEFGVDSGKVLAEGLKEIGTDYVADGRKAIVALADDVNAISKVKSIPELIRLQGEQTAARFEGIRSTTTKNVDSFRDLFSGKLAPMFKDRIKANMDLFHKAA